MQCNCNSLPLLRLRIRRSFRCSIDSPAIGRLTCAPTQTNSSWNPIHAILRFEVELRAHSDSRYSATTTQCRFQSDHIRQYVQHKCKCLRRCVFNCYLAIVCNFRYLCALNDVKKTHSGWSAILVSTRIHPSPVSCFLRGGGGELCKHS